jgi:hypothetical protein
MQAALAFCLLQLLHTPASRLETHLLGGLLRKLNTQDQVVVTKAVDLLTSPLSIISVCVADECEALSTVRLAVLGKEDTSNTAPAREEVAKFVFFGVFGDLD